MTRDQEIELIAKAMAVAEGDPWDTSEEGRLPKEIEELGAARRLWRRRAAAALDAIDSYQDFEWRGG